MKISTQGRWVFCVRPVTKVQLYGCPASLHNGVPVFKVHTYLGICMVGVTRAAISVT